VRHGERQRERKSAKKMSAFPDQEGAFSAEEGGYRSLAIENGDGADTVVLRQSVDRSQVEFVEA